jgi:organic radical activating enzyme
MFNKNCCDGIYNSFDVHFTSVCDNKCEHCIDMRFSGLGVKKPDVNAIVKTIVDRQEGYDDVLFLGGEPCLYLDELLDCIKQLRDKTKLKLFVTTALPKTCYDQRDTFIEILSLIDGINFSVQHHDEKVADKIRCVKSKYFRQAFYNSLPMKEKIRINLNIVKPFLYTKNDIIDCVQHYDKMGFNSIKISEIQHGADHFVSFEETFDIKLGSPYFSGCQKYLNTDVLFKNTKTSVLLKRSCFACEDTLKASLIDGVKVAYKMLNRKKDTKYGVVYGNGKFNKGWL